jgi:hypothetical protein
MLDRMRIPYRLRSTASLAILLAASGAAQAAATADTGASSAASTSAATATPTSTDAVTRAIETLDAHALVLAELLRRQVEQQDVAIAVQRASMAAVGVSTFEARIEDRRRRRETLQDELDQQDDMQPMRAAEEASAPPEEREERRRMREMLEKYVAKQRQQMKQIDLELVDLEAQLAEQRQDLQRWLDLVDQHFEHPPAPATVSRP